MGFILEKKVLTDVANSLRESGNTVVLTHGAYDLLHVGHIEFLKRSKAKGHVLVVGVDSDERVALYKNSSRPVIAHKQRMEMLASLGFVDFVFPLQEFEDSSEFIQIYNQLNPNIITFGYKFAVKKAKLLQEQSKLYGTMFLGITQKFSDTDGTSNIINKIKTQNIY